VVAARVLHHAPRPARALSDLAALARPGGKLCVIDYVRHEDERFQEQQADVWLGFSRAELEKLARGAGLTDARIAELPRAFVRTGPDAHLPWHCLVATKQCHPRSKNGKQETS
jgi:ArsR family transcriptional regulator